MSSAAVQDIDLKTFMKDPYPTLKYFRKNSPIAYVPQLNATLFSKHQDIFICEKCRNILICATEWTNDQANGPEYDAQGWMCTYHGTKSYLPHCVS